MKLALGTAQFGLNYGAFGSGVMVDADVVPRILERAKQAGVELLDTARAYGQSEYVLGQVRASDQFKIVTKCPKLPVNTNPAKSLLSEFNASCDALGVTRVTGYLLHDAEDIKKLGVLSVMQELVASGRVERIGVSVYNLSEAESICADYPLTLVQLPGNVLNPWYQDKSLPDHVEVHVRSAFLQGFLLAKPNNLPNYFLPWKGVLETFRSRATALGLSPLQAALAPLLQSANIDKVIVGIESLGQLNEILRVVADIEKFKSIDLGEFQEAAKSLADPRTWHD